MVPLFALTFNRAALLPAALRGPRLRRFEACVLGLAIGIPVAAATPDAASAVLSGAAAGVTEALTAEAEAASCVVPGTAGGAGGWTGVDFPIAKDGARAEAG